uniref:Uncharacterized protein n=1 Tax=Fagus sylvatica TaxID=28930 RepID=A0A2N9FYH4_FAGSY
MGLSLPFRGFFCRPLWVSLRPLWHLTSPLGGLRLLDGKGFLMWLGLSLWHMIWRLLPTRALPLERFRSESLLLYPPCLSNKSSAQLKIGSLLCLLVICLSGHLWLLMLSLLSL